MKAQISLDSIENLYRVYTTYKCSEEWEVKAGTMHEAVHNSVSATRPHILKEDVTFCMGCGIESQPAKYHVNNYGTVYVYRKD